MSPKGQARAAFGALLGLLLAGALSQTALLWAAPGAHPAWLVAPMAASAVLLFCVPASPLAQPWPVIGGNVVSALSGAACAALVPDPMLAAPLAGGLSIAMMFLLRCLHPPGGAVAMTAVLGGAAVTEAGFSFALAPVGLNSVLLVLAALAYNRLTGARHLHLTHTAAPQVVADEDIDAALAHFGEALDVRRDDLADLINDVEQQVAARRARQLSAGEVAVAPLARLAPELTLAAAREQLLRHGVPALPVVDGEDRLLGLLTHAQLLRAAGEAEGLGSRARLALAALAGRRNGAKVADVMRADVAVDAARPAHEAAALAARHHLARVPVVDGKGRLAGMAGPAEVLAALHGAALGQAA